MANTAPLLFHCMHDPKCQHFQPIPLWGKILMSIMVGLLVVVFAVEEFKTSRRQKKREAEELARGYRSVRVRK